MSGNSGGENFLYFLHYRDVVPHPPESHTDNEIKSD